MKQMIFLALLLCFSSVVEAQGPFSTPQIERIKLYKQQLGPVDKKSLEKTILELQKAEDPELALELQETMAKVYTDLVAEKDVRDPATREWLYGIVALNMANLQFGGRSRDPLNQMIAQKLKKSLSPVVLANTHFHVAVE